MIMLDSRASGGRAGCDFAGVWCLVDVFPAGFAVAGALCPFWPKLALISRLVHSRLSAEVNSVLFGIAISKKK